MLQTVIEKLTRYCQLFFSSAPQAILKPLLDGSDLRELALYAESLPQSLLAFRRPASHPLIGESLSNHRGHGLEFDENRAYQAGDEPRLLNWRLYARTGELYTKVFSEERRPQVFLLIDRRAAMRFATRGQLKAKLAAKIAACYAYQAQQQAFAIGGLVLNRSMDWFDPALGEVSLQTFLQLFVSRCAPLAFESEQPDLGESLRLIAQRLSPGSLVVLISDFADLEPGIANQLLPNLSEQHTVQAFQILDPVELQLPLSGDYLIENGASSQSLHIDGHDSVQQSLYADIFKKQQLKLVDCINRCGISMKVCTTDDDLENCLQTADSDAWFS